MINLANCRKYADMIDDATTEINSLIIIYEDAYYYIQKNKSNASSKFAEQLYNETSKLKNIKKDLISISSKIEQKASQIYNEELAEKRKKAAQAHTY